jgi:regulatory protein
MEDKYDKLLQYSLRLISKKRYTEKEILQKFKRKKIGSESEHKKVTSRLKELKYIDDDSFARDYIRTKLQLNPRGKQLLKLELRLKGIDGDKIENALEKANIDELEIAKQILDKKKRRYQGLKGQKRRVKILSILASRGFKPGTIYKILERW